MSDGDINEISLMLGKLFANQAVADQTRTEIFNKLEHISKNIVALGQSMADNKRDHAELKALVHDDIMPTIRNVRSMQAKGIGLIAGVGLTAGGVSAVLIKIASGLGIGNH